MWSWLESSNNKITETQLDEKDDLKNVNDVKDEVKELHDIKEESEEPEREEQEKEKEEQEKEELEEQEQEQEESGESDGTNEAEWEKELDRKNCSCCKKTTYIHFTIKRSHAIALILAYTFNLFLAVYGLKKH